MVVGKKVIDAGDPTTPDVFELGEHRRGRSDCVDVAAGEPLATTAAFGDQTGTLEHDHVFLHRRERLVVLLRECGYRMLGGEHTPQDVSTSAIGKRVEQRVDLTLRGG
jgi:hypothetical protein